MHLDELSRAVLVHLCDGRKSFKKIADIVGVSENTVKTRVRRMQESGLLNISAFINPDQLENAYLIYMGVSLRRCNYTDVAQRVSKLKSVTSVAIVTGRYDLMVTVLLKEHDNLLDFIQEELNDIEEIEHLESFVSHRGFNLSAPAAVVGEEHFD